MQQREQKRQKDSNDFTLQMNFFFSLKEMTKHLDIKKITKSLDGLIQHMQIKVLETKQNTYLLDIIMPYKI